LKSKATGTALGIAAAVPVAFFVAVAGTALHRQTAVIAGVELPAGACGALLLLASVQLLLGAAFRSIIPTAVSGAACYAAVGVLSSAGPRKLLILGDALGNAWIYGILVVTIAMLLWCRRYRKVTAGP
jgi:N-acetyl-1-D-myo-inositol-2-amino-2-deoxy-alpha-D-glucopyranoside deacetylase